jgi:uncharacterized protein (TIGR02145 family)
MKTLKFSILLSILFFLTITCKKDNVITLPTLAINAITNFTTTTATIGGEVTSDGGSAIIARGVCWATTANPTTANSFTTNGTGIGSFISTLTGLTEGTTYYLRAYATNSKGTAYGTQQIFTTSKLTIPSLNTMIVSAISDNTATSGGNITSDGGLTVTAYGVCWNTSQTPTINDSKTSDGSGTGVFTSSLSGLTAGTVYYIRAYATNSKGTAYGTQQTFTTTIADGTIGTIADVDGNIYKTIAIGGQIWMAENLKTTKYKDGTAIPNITESNTWGSLTTPAYCWYNNNAENSTVYGALYNWYTVYTDKLAPKGWHVPTDAEWTTLTTYLGGDSVAGNKLKEIGNTHWQYKNTDANNISGFTALPGGCRQSRNGSFEGIRLYGQWWSSSEYPNTNSWNKGLNYRNSNVWRGTVEQSYGLSVRCLRDF